jgi:tol-pal system protein YbgF
MATHSAENSIPAEFDAGVFWITYKTRIITFAALLIVALLLVATFQMAQHRKATYSRELLNSSSTPSEYQMVIDRYPGTMAAGNAHLLLAAKQREEGKYEDAIATLESFVRNYPDHPLVGGAELSIGETQRAAKQREKALETFETTASKYRDSYGAPAAMLAEASIYIADGKSEDARRVLEDLISQFPESYMVHQAQAELRSLKIDSEVTGPADDRNATD